MEHLNCPLGEQISGRTEARFPCHIGHVLLVLASQPANLNMSQGRVEDSGLLCTEFPCGVMPGTCNDLNWLIEIVVHLESSALNVLHWPILTRLNSRRHSIPATVLVAVETVA